MSGKYALIIGNTEYSDHGLTQLTAPGKDTEDFARVLKNQDLCAFDQVNILLNQLSSTVIEAIDEFFDQKNPDDLLVLYFSGHGVRDELGYLYLAVKNTIRSRLRSTAIRSDYIREAMDQSHSKRQVLILDCCNSGAFPQGTKAEIGGTMGMTQAFQGYGRFVLTASDATQFAWEGNTVIGETQNSLFTHFLVKGLEGDADKNGDGRITIDELYDYAFEQISSLTPKQTPTKSISKQEGEIILRQNMRLEDIKPVPLPTVLLDSIENPFPDVRLGAVQQLTKLLNGKNLALARSAREALERMAENDDSRQVSKAAAQALQSLDPGEQLAEQTTEAERGALEKAGEQQVAHEKTDQKRLAPEKAEAERLAPEKLKRESSTQQKAEAGGLAREKSRAERKAKEEASREDKEKAEKEKAEREKTNRATPAKAQQEAVRKANVIESTAVKAPWITPTTLGMVVIALILFGFFARNYFGNIGTPAATEPATIITEAPTISPTEPSVAIITEAPANTPVPPTEVVAAPDGLSGYLNDVQILNVDTFDDSSGWNVVAGRIENGVMDIVGIGDGNWDGASRNGEFGENEGIVIHFNYSTNSFSEIYLDHGEWDTDQYKRFGVYVGDDHPYLDAYAGQSDLGGANLSGNLTLTPGTTYSLLIAILPNGEFLEAIWNPSNSSETIFYREKFDESWAGLPWSLWIGCDHGTIQFDNFNKIKFSSAK